MTEIRRRGVSCVEPELDESWMYTQVDYATGDRGFEQVLGWDDKYTHEEWPFLGDAGRLFVPPVLSLADGGSTEPAEFVPNLGRLLLGQSPPRIRHALPTLIPKPLPDRAVTEPRLLGQLTGVTKSSTRAA
jgi:hypothetical protein